MSARPYVLAETTWKSVKEINYEAAVLPWGATEAHNLHLPYCTDNIQSDYIAIESARLAWEKGAKIIVLPCVPFGVNTGQMDIKLVINMSPSTQAQVLRDVTDSLDRQGIYKLVIINGHGGNNFKQMIREIQKQYSEMFISVIDWYKVLDNKKYFDEAGDHAGEMETSNMMVIKPELVLPLSEAGSGKEKKFRIEALREGWAWAQRDWGKISEDTGVGNPAKATKEKGKRFLDALTEKIAKYFVELCRCDINDLYEK